jgi:hypothetical protein
LRLRTAHAAYAVCLIVGGALAGCNGDPKPTKTAGAPSATAALKPGVGPTLGPLPETTDPREIARRLVKAYQSVNSMQVASAYDLMVEATRSIETHQEMVTTYLMNPPRISRFLVDRMTGSHQFFADGSNLISYAGLSNTYMRREARGDMRSLCKALDGDSAQLLGVTTLLGSENLPEGMTNFKYVGKEDVKGRPAYVVTATYTPQYLQGLGKRLQRQGAVKPVKADVRLWVDRENHFLLRAKTRIDWRVQTQGSKQTSQLAATYDHTTTKIITNPAVTEADFKFKVPPKAVEVFVPRDATTGQPLSQ